MTIRVVVAEDGVLMLEGITTILAMEDDLEVVAVCTDLPELEAAIAAHAPDVVVTDIRMPPTQTDEGIRAAQQLREDRPEVGVVVLSQYAESEYAVRLFEGGSNGRAYLLKERLADPGELAEAIHRVHQGGSVVDATVVESLIASRTGGRRSVLERLTEREFEVLSEMAKGGSNAAIGEALFISPRSVEKHINSIFTKLDLTQEPNSNRRVRAVLVYLAEGGP